ncbi:plasmid partition family protein [Borreliella finlandensis]
MLKLYSKILEGSISINKIKELGLENIKNIFFKKNHLILII